MYIVIDNCGMQVGPVFHSYKEAETFRIKCQRYDWDIIKLNNKNNDNRYFRSSRWE